MGKDVSILELSEGFQLSIAESTMDPVMLNFLAKSPSDLVRMAAVANPEIRTETLKEKLNDEDVNVRWNAHKALEKRGVNI